MPRTILVDRDRGIEPVQVQVVEAKRITRDRLPAQAWDSTVDVLPAAGRVAYSIWRKGICQGNNRSLSHRVGLVELRDSIARAASIKDEDTPVLYTLTVETVELACAT
jgi:hypothetical protein